MQREAQEAIDSTQETIDSNTIQTKIDRILEMIDEIRSIDESKFSFTVEEVYLLDSILDKIMKSNQLNKFLSRTSTKLLRETLVEAIDEHLTKILIEISSYRDSKNTSYLINANELTKPIQTIFTTLAEQYPQLMPNYNNENDIIQNGQVRIDAFINDIQTQFLNSQSERAQKFNMQLKELHDARMDDMVASKDLFDDYGTKAQSELEKMQQLNLQAEEILGAIGMKAHAEGYRRIANNEGQKAFLWNVLSIASLVGILWFGFEFIIEHKGELSWTALASRALLTGVGLTLFTYCAKQSTNHRNEEKRNRKIQLELATLTPYLQDLDPTQQKEVKQSLVNKYFGVELPTEQAQANNVVTDLTKNPQFMQTLAQKVVEFLPSGK